MPWSKPKRKKGRMVPGQIGIVKMYQSAAGIPDDDYRSILQQTTGCGATSSTDRRLNNKDFDLVMPVLEHRLQLAIINDQVERPTGFRFRNLKYWRNKCRTDRMTSRQQKLIEQHWCALAPVIGRPSCMTDDYLLRIACKASASDLRSIYDLSPWCAHLLIEALKDRLAHL